MDKPKPTDVKKLSSEVYPKGKPEEGDKKKEDNDSDYDWDFEDEQE